MYVDWCQYLLITSVEVTDQKVQFYQSPLIYRVWFILNFSRREWIKIQNGCLLHQLPPPRSSRVPTPLPVSLQGNFSCDLRTLCSCSCQNPVNFTAFERQLMNLLWDECCNLPSTTETKELKGVVSFPSPFPPSWSIFLCSSTYS